MDGIGILFSVEKQDALILYWDASEQLEFVLRQVGKSAIVTNVPVHRTHLELSYGSVKFKSPLRSRVW